METAYELWINELKVPEENVIGEVGKGFYHLLDLLNSERFMVSAEMIGNAEWFINKGSSQELTSAYFSLLLNTYGIFSTAPLIPSFFFPCSVWLHPSLQGLSGETLGSPTSSCGYSWMHFCPYLQ